MAELCGDQHVVDSLLCQQLLMRPLLHHHSPLEYSYAVCIADGGQTVGHDDACPAFTGLVQSVLYNLQREDCYYTLLLLQKNKLIIFHFYETLIPHSIYIIDKPSRSQCPVQRWLHPAAELGGCEE